MFKFFFQNAPLSSLLNTSYPLIAVVPTQYSILISQHFTNPHLFYFSSCFYPVHELSSHINFEILIFRALEPGCYVISDNELGSQNVRV